MAFDPALVDRIRSALGPQPDVHEKRMFGGVAFLLGDRMFCGVVGDELMVRVGPERYDDALARPHARPMDFTGRPMKGYVFVSAEGCGTTREVGAWIEQGLAFVPTLPAKPPKRKR